MAKKAFRSDVMGERRRGRPTVRRMDKLREYLEDGLRMVREAQD